MNYGTAVTIQSAKMGRVDIQTDVQEGVSPLFLTKAAEAFKT
jgi:hypothetical protein